MLKLQGGKIMKKTTVYAEWETVLIIDANNAKEARKEALDDLSSIDKEIISEIEIEEMEKMLYKVTALCVKEEEFEVEDPEEAFFIMEKNMVDFFNSIPGDHVLQEIYY